MPYIKKDLRRNIDEAIASLSANIVNNADESSIEGVMNYTITSLLDNIVYGSGEKKWRYKFINRVIGVLECIKLEFYRQLAGPYENKAIEENGNLPIYEG